MGLILALLLFYLPWVRPNWAVWPVIPLAVAQLVLLGLGTGLAVSALTTRYRDLQVLVGFGMQLWMYASPIVYPLSAAEGALGRILRLNPVTVPVELIRYAILGQGTIVPAYLALSWAITLLVAVFGVMIFNHVEKTFMDTV